MTIRILSVAIEAEIDVVTARQRARDVAALCGFGPQDQARVATAVTEMARNVHSYAGRGLIEFYVEEASGKAGPA
jgi:anti-sigma regulatory factor (Ser/Thr protein kinase)